ncbi:hypothetical protein ACROYT_G041208 [Oculina patagonica]
MIQIHDVMMTDNCGVLCYMEYNCASYNLMRRSDTEGYKCELNNSTHEGNEQDLEENPNYVYRGTKSACLKNLCKNNATCQTGFKDKGYRCSCTPGFQGPECQYDVDECSTLTHDCSADGVCSNTEGSYSCYCKPGYSGDGRKCDDIEECALGTHDCNVYAVCGNTKGSYNCTCKPTYYGDGRICEVLQCEELNERKLTNESKPYCGLGACGFEHWTLVMKINGSKETFRYHSNLWSNNETLNLAGGENVFDTQETKLTTYWDTPFSKICLGMRIHGEENMNFLVIDKSADSLYSLIADGEHHTTSLGRDTWKTLIGSQASLQSNCNMEGFNARCYWDPNSRARIGFVANNQDDCWTCDSRIGFGTGGSPDESNTCGNVANGSGDNGEKYLDAMCYIFVR